MSKKNKVLLIACGLLAYLLIGGLLVLRLHDRVPLVLLMMFNYALAAMIFGPLLPVVFESKGKQGSENEKTKISDLS